MRETSQHETLPARFFANARRSASRVAHYYSANGHWFPVGFATMAGIVRDLASGLIALGHEPSQPVAILSVIRREWTYVDLAVMSIGGVTVGIDADFDNDTQTAILQHCDASICFVDDTLQMHKLHEFASSSPRLQVVVRFGDSDTNVVDTLPTGVTVVTYSDVLRLGRRENHDVEARIRALTPMDAATFLYTSGTTGAPKAAMLTHGNLVASIKALSTLDVSRADLGFSFLSPASALPRAFEHLSVWLGMQTVYASGRDRLVDDLLAMKPTVMMTVPRVLEVLHSTVYEDMYTLAAGRRLLSWANKIGKHTARQKRQGRRVATTLDAQMHLARRLVFNRFRTCLGGRMRHIFVSGGMVSPAFVYALEACGVQVSTGWSMTETFSAGTLARSGDIGDDDLVASVGEPIPGIELKLADDGELLARGPCVFSGYYKDDARTRAAFTVDGYLRTGDIARVESNGSYRIIDRKPHSIQTQSGTSVAPRTIENLVRVDPRVSQIIILGDERPYLTALISVTDSLRQIFDQKTLEGMLEDIIHAVNVDLVRAQQIREFRLLPYDFSVDSGELTPSLQLRRDFITERFRYLIEEMYE